MTLEAQVAVRVGDLDIDVTLEASEGEVVAVLGPNGAGKTTLLRSIAGLEPLRRGRIEVDDEVLEDVAAGIRVPPERRPVGFVFQDYLLFPHLSVLDNVAFGVRSRGARRSEARREASAWLEALGLAALARSRPHRLSGGQAQRVALARALVTKPRLLLLDEPLAALDATARSGVRRELRRHLSSFGGIRLLVTHDPLEAMTMADRLVILEAGHVVQSGTPSQVRDRPQSRYVAELVGVNLFAGRAQGGQVTLEGGGRLAAPDAGAGQVLAVVHPRAVALHRQAPLGSPRNVWRGTVEGLDLEGERVRVHVGGLIPIVAEVTPAAVEELSLGDGGQVWVAVKATEITAYPA